MAEVKFYAHPTTVIDAGAEIGEGTTIWHFCHIMTGSKIGEKCNIGQAVYVDSGVIIGNGVKIQNNVSVYNGVTIEDDVFLGPSMVFTNVINPRSFIDRKSEFKQTRVCRGATIGANVTVLCGVTVGKYAMVGAGSVLINDVADYAIVIGNPAKQDGWISKSGHRLHFGLENVALCANSGEKYILHQGIVNPL
jgi:UDP-2-acetamido-3-amino-2,3-dideoxy-glucuronate N-acetyltransferase